MSQNAPDEARDSAEIDSALAVATESRAVLRFAIDAMPQQFPPGSMDAILGVILQNLTSVIHGSFEGAVVLCREGWGLEADVLLRQMMEAVVNARAVRNNRTALYLYIEEIERQIDMPEEKKQGRGELPLRPTDIVGVPTPDDPLAWQQRGKHRGKRRYWRDIKMEERVKLSELEADIWYGVYRKLCPGVHAAPIALARYLVKASPTDTAPVAVWFGPSWQAAFRAVGTACALLLVHLGTIGSAFDIQLDQEIRELGERLQIFRAFDSEC